MLLTIRTTHQPATDLGLPHAYEPFSPLVSRRHTRRRRLTADAEEGDETPRGINRSLNWLLNPVANP